MCSLVVLVGFACLLSSVCSVPTSRFDCWSCKNMFSDEECTKEGEATLCNWNQVCYTESRVENGLYIINRGCKEINACEQLHMQNRTQCHPEINPSVCRTCCEKDHCNYHLDAGKGILNGSSEIPSTPNPVNGGSFIGARILNGGVTPKQPDEPKAPNCSHYIKPGPVPANLLPEEECRVNILPQCINSGSLRLCSAQATTFSKGRRVD
uniref:UPAR/Ly6 domain-containing protein n=1 Tax=Ciona savignyi TaxID=51511 RepID=H2YAF0_CIOSA